MIKRNQDARKEWICFMVCVFQKKLRHDIILYFSDQHRSFLVARGKTKML